MHRLMACRLITLPLLTEFVGMTLSAGCVYILTASLACTYRGKTLCHDPHESDPTFHNVLLQVYINIYDIIFSMTIKIFYFKLNMQY